MRATISFAATLAVAVSLGAARAPAAVLIEVNKSAQQMTVSVDGQQRYVWPVSTGRSGYDTPSGSFHPFRMEAEHSSKEWDDAPMPHSIFFTEEGHAIHGTYETKYLGAAVSHGCVRISPAHATTLFDLVKREGLTDTKVVLTGRAPARAPLIARRAQPVPVYGSADDRTAAAAPIDANLNSNSYRPSYGQFNEDGAAGPTYSAPPPEPVAAAPRARSVAAR